MVTTYACAFQLRFQLVKTFFDEMNAHQKKPLKGLLMLWKHF